MIDVAARRSSAVRRAERERGALRAFLLVAVVPNLLLRAAEFSLTGTATLVDLEYLAIALAAPWLGPGPTALALGIAIAADATTFIAPIFHFEVGAVLTSLSQLALAAPFTFALIAAAAIALVGVVAWAIVRATSLRSLRDWRIRLTLVGAIALLVAADAANGSGNAISTRRAFLSVNVAGAPTLQIAVATVRSAQDRRLPQAPVIPVASATSPLFQELAAGNASDTLSENVAIVLVESMGQLLDAKADSVLFSTLIDSAITARYEVRRGTVHFNGPTTGGEFRELCGQLRTYRSAPTAPLATCLPARLRARGYSTIALHAFRRGLFNRKDWYPRIGIDSIVDDAAIRDARKVTECGTIFRGPCDRDVAPIFTRLLSTPSGVHRLVYWLTLSAHFPAENRAAEGASFDCAVSPSLAADESACLLARIWSTDLASVRDAALSPAVPRTRFFVVGDHAPPLPPERAARLFASDVVPYVELRPLPRGDVVRTTPAVGARAGRSTHR